MSKQISHPDLISTLESALEGNGQTLNLVNIDRVLKVLGDEIERVTFIVTVQQSNLLQYIQNSVTGCLNCKDQVTKGNKCISLELAAERLVKVKVEPYVINNRISCMENMVAISLAAEEDSIRLRRLRDLFEKLVLKVIESI